MHLGELQVFMDLKHKEYEPFIINGECQALIKFCFHPDSVYRKTWFTKSKATETKYRILHQIFQPITGNNPIQIGMDTFSTLSSCTFTDFLSCVPEITSEQRESVAENIILQCRKLVDGNKTVEISVEIKTSIVILLEEKDMQVVNMYERHYSGTIPVSKWSVASLKRLGSCRPNDDVCSICYEEELEGWDVIRMKCSHEFHEKCILEWLKKNRCCPICRFKMPSCIYEELF